MFHRFPSTLQLCRPATRHARPGSAPTRGLKVFAHTFRSPTPSALEKHLQDLPINWLDNTGLLWVVSHSLPVTLLPGVLHLLSAHPNNIGSFVAMPYDEPLLSVALFSSELDKGEGRVATFQIGETGRPPETVGRWHRIQNNWRHDPTAVRARDAVVQRAIQTSFDSMWRPRGGGAASPKLGENSDVEAVICLTDSAPTPTLEAMDNYPRATKLGVITANTSFLTGREHTLFYNGQVFDAGSVGIALPAKPRHAGEESNAEPMGKVLTVGSAHANLLMSLDGPVANPTDALLTAIRERGKGSKGKEDFYLKIMEDKHPTRISRILSGEPDKGALTIETTTPLTAGMKVQFMHRPADALAGSAARDGRAVPPPSVSALRFGTLSTTEATRSTAIADQPGVERGFVATSTAGFITGGEGTGDGEGAGVCRVAGASSTVEW